MLCTVAALTFSSSTSSLRADHAVIHLPSVRPPSTRTGALLWGLAGSAAAPRLVRGGYMRQIPFEEEREEREERGGGDLLNCSPGHELKLQERLLRHPSSPLAG